MNQTLAAPLPQSAQEERNKNERFYRFLATGIVPEWLIRVGIRRMLAKTLRDHKKANSEDEIKKRVQFVKELQGRPIAIQTDAANEQHYEVPTAFFQQVLGPHMKYSSAYWAAGQTKLAAAENEMLALTCQRASIENGHQILELGCGWGSLTLFMAENFPNSSIMAVSNSKTQRQHIEAEAAKRGLTNIRVITENMENFDPGETFDRVVSVEMFEHMKNYDLLLERIASWLVPQGKLFVHIFSHKNLEYHYEDADGTDWLTRHFFAGGIMPSDPLLFYFQRSLTIAEHWRVNGRHYQATAEAWLQNMSARREQIMPILSATYGEKEAKNWYVYWRLFFLACAELWGYKNGEEWMVSHYLFVKPVR